jgi:DNA-directed RNA polymerase specialized sigma subunit
MINYIKIGEKGKMFGSANVMLCGKEHPDIITLINCSLQLCSYIEKNWTDKQRILLKKIILEKKNQREAAFDLGIDQSSVQRRLKAAGFYDYNNVKSSLSKILWENWGEMNGK